MKTLNVAVSTSATAKTKTPAIVGAKVIASDEDYTLYNVTTQVGMNTLRGKSWPFMAKNFAAILEDHPVYVIVTTKSKYAIFFDESLMLVDDRGYDIRKSHPDISAVSKAVSHLDAKDQLQLGVSNPSLPLTLDQLFAVGRTPFFVTNWSESLAARFMDIEDAYSAKMLPKLDKIAPTLALSYLAGQKLTQLQITSLQPHVANWAKGVSAFKCDKSQTGFLNSLAKTAYLRLCHKYPAFKSAKPSSVPAVVVKAKATTQEKYSQFIVVNKLSKAAQNKCISAAEDAVGAKGYKEGSPAYTKLYWETALDTAQNIVLSKRQGKPKLGVVKAAVKPVSSTHRSDNAVIQIKKEYLRLTQQNSFNREDLKECEAAGKAAAKKRKLTESSPSYESVFYDAALVAAKEIAKVYQENEDSDSQFE